MAFDSQRIPLAERNEFLRLARDRYVFAMQLDSEDRALALDDVEFAVALPVKGAGTTQWNREAAMARVATKRPVVTENRLPTFTAQVVNDGRQSKPAIKISAMDGGTKETAEYYQGRIRQIEYDCTADITYDTAREQQVTCGRAFSRVTWRYVPGSFKKEARIEPITNQFSVVFGPAREYDCSDADYCFVVSLISKEEHGRRYGKETTVAHTDFATNQNPAIGWLGTGPNGELVQVAEYWLKEYSPRTLVRLSNGKELWKDEIPDGLDKMGITIEEERVDQDVTVVQYIIDGAEIQDETVFFGPYIGIVPTWGREWFVGDKRCTSSLIRYAKDPQRLLNLYVSNIAEQIAQMPKTPYFVPVGGIPAGSQAQYDNLNTDPRQYAYYNQYDEEQRRLDAPSRVINEPPIMALVAGYNQAVDAIKAAMGIYDASLGDRGNETSGIAINSRKRESDNANFHFHDNEARSRNHIGRILLWLIPELDKGVGMRAVRSVEGKTRMVMTGKPWRDPETNKVVHHDLTNGNYGVAVDTAPSYDSQREEGFTKLTQMATQWPALLQVGGPKILRLSDIPGSDELADLMEKTLPANLRTEKPDARPTIPPEVQQQVSAITQQAGQVIENLTNELNQLQDDMKAQRIQMEYRLRMTEIQEDTKKEIALAELNQAEGLELLRQDLASIKHQLELQQAAADRAHQAEQADRDRGHQIAMQPAAAPETPEAAAPQPEAPAPAAPPEPATPTA